MDWLGSICNILFVADALLASHLMYNADRNYNKNPRILDMTQAHGDYRNSTSMKTIHIEGVLFHIFKLDYQITPVRNALRNSFF